MAEAVQPWWRDAVGHGQIERQHKLMKRLAGVVWVDAALAVEGEQRLLAARRPFFSAALELLAEERGDPRAVRYQSALAELPAADDEQITGGVDIAKEQSARIGGA
jgi:hypothetical protein